MSRPRPLTSALSKQEEEEEEEVDAAVTAKKGLQGAVPAKGSIATDHLGDACKHTRGLSTCIVVSK
jgi:hypothetical protein